jgi:hypothetical protein
MSINIPMKTGTIKNPLQERLREDLTEASEIYEKTKPHMYKYNEENRNNKKPSKTVGRFSH